MPIKVNFFRLMAIPACLIWGFGELISLQRARLRSGALAHLFRLS
jgi:hypothetical protein